MGDMRNEMAKWVLLAAMAALTPVMGAEIPNSGGKLDYGAADVPVLPVLMKNTTAPRTAQLLLEQYRREKMAFHRAQLVSELGQTRLAESLPGLMEAFGDRDAMVRVSAVQAVVILCDGGTRSADAKAAAGGSAALKASLNKMLKGDDETLACAALRALVSIEGSQSSAVAQALASPADSRLFAAALAVVETTDQRAIVTQKLPSIGEAQKPAALLALGRSGDQGYAHAIEAMMGSKAAVAVNVAGCQGLAKIKAESAVGTLQPLLGHAHPSVRREAVLAMGQCASADARTSALKAITDTDFPVRAAAAEVLGPILSPEVVLPLVEQLSSEYRPLHDAARQALSLAKDEATRQKVIEAAGALLDNRDPRRCEDGSFLLGHYRSDYQLQRHIELAKGVGAKPDVALVSQAVESLGLIGRPDAKEVVMVHARGDNAGVGQLACAIVAAGRLGCVEVLPIAQHLMNANPERTDATCRGASAFATGLLADAKSPVVRSLTTLLKSQFDVTETKAEAIKAMGNLKLRSAVSTLNKEDSGLQDDPLLRWLAEWAIGRIEDTPAKHTAAEGTWVAETSVTDMPPLK